MSLSLGFQRARHCDPLRRRSRGVCHRRRVWLMLAGLSVLSVLLLVLYFKYCSFMLSHVEPPSGTVADVELAAAAETVPLTSGDGDGDGWGGNDWEDEGSGWGSSVALNSMLKNTATDDSSGWDGGGWEGGSDWASTTKGPAAAAAAAPSVPAAAAVSALPPPVPKPKLTKNKKAEKASKD